MVGPFSKLPVDVEVQILCTNQSWGGLSDRNSIVYHSLMSTYGCQLFGMKIRHRMGGGWKVYNYYLVITLFKIEGLLALFCLTTLIWWTLTFIVPYRQVYESSELHVIIKQAVYQPDYSLIKSILFVLHSTLGFFPTAVVWVAFQDYFSNTDSGVQEIYILIATVTQTQYGSSSQNYPVQ